MDTPPEVGDTGATGRRRGGPPRAAAGPGFTADTVSVVEGAVLVATVLAWSTVIDWLAFRFRRVEGALDPAPVMLIKDGRMLPDAMRAELVTRAELMTHLRKDGISDLAEVREACMEADGMISIIRRGAPRTEGATATTAAPSP